MYYPSTEEVNESLLEIEAAFEDPYVYSLITQKGGSDADAAVDSYFDYTSDDGISFGRDSFVPENYPAGVVVRTQSTNTNIEKFLVARTVEHIPGEPLSVIEAKPNDPTNILEVMDRTSPQAHGLANRYRDEGVTSTTHISLIYYGDAATRIYDSKNLNQEVVRKDNIHSLISGKYVLPERSRPESLTFENLKEIRGDSLMSSVAWQKQYPNFDATLKTQFLIEMNHRLAQEALDRQRRYDAKGNEIQEQDRKGLSFKETEGMANEVMKSAWNRTMHICAMNRELEKQRKANKENTRKYQDKLKPIVKSQSFVSGFGKKIERKKGETLRQAIPRIRAEYKEHAEKEIQKLENKGFEIILAQAIADERSRKNLAAGINRSTSVSMADLLVAKSIIRDARKDPITFNSTDRILQEATREKSIREMAMKKLDGRSTFQRSYKTLTTLGEYMSADKNGRTRRKTIDKDAGKLFTAQVLKDTPPKRINLEMKKAMDKNGYSVNHAIEARRRMESMHKNEIIKVKTDKSKSAEEVSKEKILREVKERAAREAKEQEKVNRERNKKSPDDDNPRKKKGRSPKR